MYTIKIFSLFFLILFSLNCIGQDEPAADALVEAENYEAALDIYATLSADFLKQEDYENFLRMRMKESVLQQDIGEYGTAKNLLESTLSEVKNHLPIDTNTALIYHKLGVSNYYLGQYETAIQNWQAAINIRLQYLSANDNDIAKGYKNIGSAKEKLGHFLAAERNYKKSIDLLLTNSDRNVALLADDYREMGYLSSIKNDIELAKTYYFSALKLYEEIYVEEPWNLGIVYSDLSSFFFDMKDYQKVIEYGEKTIAIYDELEDKYDEDYWAMADAYNNIGLAHLSLGELFNSILDLDKAILPLKKAITINQNPDFGRKTHESTNRTNLSLTYKALKKYPQAFEQTEKSLTIDTQLKDDISLAINTNNRGEIYFDQKKYNLALKDFQTAVRFLVSKFESNDFFDNPSIQNAIIQDKISLVAILHNKAKTLRLLSKEDRYQQLAISTYDSLFVLINLMQNEVSADESKRFLAAKSKTIFEAAIQANLDFYSRSQQNRYLARTFELAEQSKAVSLFDQLSESQAKSESNIPDHLLQREQKLKRQIKTLEQDIFETEKGEKSSVELRTQLITTNRQLEKLVDTLEQQYATYFNLKYASTSTKLAAIQQKILAPNQAMIQYFMGDSSLTILYSDQKTSKAIQKTRPKDLLQQIELFRTAIIEQDMNVADYQSKAYALYQLLLEDVPPNSADIQRLIIVPDGILAYLPFEILISAEDPNENDFRFLPYLLRQYAVSYSYSASVLAKQQNYHSYAKKYLAAFAPSYEKELAESDQLTRLLVRSGNYNLPGALEEARAIHQLMGGDLFTEMEATEALFKATARDYQNLHLSMHGIVNDSFPLRSKLLFFEDSNDSTQDASLYAYELYNMQLNCDLVVLSACNTGMGQLQKGEGVMSLSHAFAYAGVASTVMSLWQVPDASTSTLLQDFYRNLKAEIPKEVAMQQAKLNFLDNTISLKQTHPFYWAALLNYGNQEVLELEQKSSIWLLGGILLLVALLILVILRRKKSA